MDISLIEKIIKKLTKDSKLEFFNDELIDLKIEETHKRRLSTVYIADASFTNLGNTKLSIKIVKCDNKSPEDIERVKQKIVDEYNKHLNAYSNFHDTNDCIVVRPVCVIPEDLVIITETFDKSNTLESMIAKRLIFSSKQKMDELENLMHSSGQLLSQYHKDTSDNTTSAEDEINQLKEYIMIRLNLIYSYFNDTRISYPKKKSPNLFDKELTQLSNNSKSKDNHNLRTCTHGDFTPANILYDGEKLALIDFSEVSTASRFVDTGSFVNYLVMLPINKPFYSCMKVNKLIIAFQKGYSSNINFDSSLSRLHQFRYLTTNMLTQIYEMQNSKIKALLMHNRIKRYMRELESFDFSIPDK